MIGTRLSRRRSPVRRALVALLLLSACHPRPEAGFDAQQPRTAAVRNIGSFSEALRCMDTLFEAHGKRDIYITTAGIPDATGLIAAGTKEMFISAVSRMSARSNAFRFVDYDITQLDVQVLSELVGLRQDFVAPSYYTLSTWEPENRLASRPRYQGVSEMRSFRVLTWTEYTSAAPSPSSTAACSRPRRAPEFHWRGSTLASPATRSSRWSPWT